MGKLVDGTWVEAPERGHEDRGFEAWIGQTDGDGDPEYPAEPGRYHLYISRACPWAHRAALARRLRGLEDVISVDIVDPIRRNKGWEFTPSKQTCTPDSMHAFEYLREVYTHADPAYTGRVTVPVLYQLPGVGSTCNMDHIKAHYYRSHDDINPTGFVPVGPAVDWATAHNRARLGGSAPVLTSADK